MNPATALVASILKMGLFTKMTLGALAVAATTDVTTGSPASLDVSESCTLVGHSLWLRDRLGTHMADNMSQRRFRVSQRLLPRVPCRTTSVLPRYELSTFNSDETTWFTREGRGLRRRVYLMGRYNTRDSS